jgi:hypothetical protein
VGCASCFKVDVPPPWLWCLDRRSSFGLLAPLAILIFDCELLSSGVRSVRSVRSSCSWCSARRLARSLDDGSINGLYLRGFDNLLACVGEGGSDASLDSMLLSDRVRSILRRFVPGGGIPAYSCSSPGEVPSAHRMECVAEGAGHEVTGMSRQLERDLLCASR